MPPTTIPFPPPRQAGLVPPASVLVLVLVLVSPPVPAVPVPGSVPEPQVQAFPPLAAVPSDFPD